MRWNYIFSILRSLASDVLVSTKKQKHKMKGVLKPFFTNIMHSPLISVHFPQNKIEQKPETHFSYLTFFSLRHWLKGCAHFTRTVTYMWRLNCWLVYICTLVSGGKGACMNTEDRGNILSKDWWYVLCRLQGASINKNWLSFLVHVYR